MARACEKDTHERFVGTPDYASSRSLLGQKQSACDDMESLAYTLLHLCLEDVPWFLNSASGSSGATMILESLPVAWEVLVDSSGSCSVLDTLRSALQQVAGQAACQDCLFSRRL